MKLIVFISIIVVAIRFIHFMNLKMKSNLSNQELKKCLKDKPWRISEYDEIVASELTSKEIKTMIDSEIKLNILELLKQNGFHKVSKTRQRYCKIYHELVYEIEVTSIRKTNKGIRKLKGYVYPLCMVYYDEKSDESFCKVAAEKNFPFVFDCSTKENIKMAVQDIKELITEELFPFFDQYPDIKAIKNFYIKEYKKSDILDVRNYILLLKNAAFYLGMNDMESAKKDLNLLLESKNEYEKTNQNLLELYQNSSSNPKNKTAWMDKAQMDYYTEYMQKHMEHLAIAQELFTILNDENMYTKWHEKQINQAMELIMKSNFYLTS